MARKVLVAAYPVIWVFSVAFFWLFTSGSDAMGYSLLFIWILSPLAIAVISFLMGRVRAWGAGVWIAPVALGLAYMMLPWATFSMGNTIMTGNVHAPDFGMALVAAFISVIALFAGRATAAKRMA